MYIYIAHGCILHRECTQANRAVWLEPDQPPATHPTPRNHPPACRTRPDTTAPEPTPPPSLTAPN